MIAFGYDVRKQNLQVKLTRSLPCGGDFVSYIDAIGEAGRDEMHHRLENDDIPIRRNSRRVCWPSIHS